MARDRHTDDYEIKSSPFIGHVLPLMDGTSLNDDVTLIESGRLAVVEFAKD